MRLPTCHEFAVAVDPDDKNTKYVNDLIGFTYDISKPGTPIAPSGYGEYNLENWVGPGGTSMSAMDAVRLAAALADPDGGRDIHQIHAAGIPDRLPFGGTLRL